MPFFVKIQNVYRASRKLRPTIRSFERYKSCQGPPTIGDQKNKVAGDTSDNRIIEEFDSNSTITSRVKIEEPESGLIINLDLDYSFKTVPVNIDDNVVTDEAIGQSDKDSALRPILESYFSTSGDNHEGPISKEVDTPHLFVMAKPTPHHPPDPAHLQKGSGTALTITKQNPVPVRYNAKVRGTIDINSKKLTNQQLGDTLRTVVGNVVGNAFQTLLQNAHSHGMSTKSMTNQENQPLPFNINEMRVLNARGMSSGAGKQNGGKKQNASKSKNGGNVQDVDYAAIKTQVLDEATITPPGRSRPKPQTKKCSMYKRDPDVRATCKVNRAPCKKKDESSSSRTEQCAHVSAFTAHSGSVMSNQKSSITEKKEIVEETKPLQRKQRSHTIDIDVIPKEKVLSDLANDSLTLTATQINPSRSNRASKNNAYNNVDVPPFYHILPKYKEHFENKQKKTLTEDLTTLKSDIAASKGSDTKLSKVLHENNSTKSSDIKSSNKGTTNSKKPASRLNTDDFKNLLDSIREPSKKVPEKKSYNEIPVTENILSTPLRSDKIPQNGKESKGSDRNEKNPTTSKQDSGKGAGSEKTERIDCSSYLQSVGSGQSSDKSGSSGSSLAQNKNPIPCRGLAPTGPHCKSSAKTTGNSSKSECGGISDVLDSVKTALDSVEAARTGNKGSCSGSSGGASLIDCSKFTTGVGGSDRSGGSDSKEGSSKSANCSQYKTVGSGTTAPGSSPVVDCSRFTKGASGDTSSTKSGAAPPIDCSKYTSGGEGTVEDQKSCALDTKVGAPPPIDCSKYITGGGGKVGAPPPIDCSKYISGGGGGTVRDQKSGASDTKSGAPPPIDCSKYITGGGGKVGAPPPIDCSKYTSGGGGTVRDQKAGASDTKAGSPPPIDCSKYITGGGGKVGAPPPIDCSKYTSGGGGGTVRDQKSGASDTKASAPPPIDCSKYITGGGGKVGAPPPIDCSKYTSGGGGGTVRDQKSGASDTKASAPPPIDCSKYITGGGGTAGDTSSTKSATFGASTASGASCKSGASDTKVEAPPPIDCSKYISGRGGGTVRDQKSGASDTKVDTPQQIDCSKYITGGGGTAGDTSTKSATFGASTASGASSKSAKLGASDTKVGPPPSIDCSKYTTGCDATSDTSTKSPTSGALATPGAPRVSATSRASNTKAGAPIDCSKYSENFNNKAQSTSQPCCPPSGDQKPGKSTISPPSNGCKSIKIEITDKITAGNIRVESSTAQQTKPKADFCRAREPKSKVNKNSGTDKRNCLPVMCSKGKRLEVKAPEPAKRIPIEDTKSSLFNCSLKIAGSRNVEILNSAMPKMCDDHVMIKMHTVGLCGSDVYMFDKGVEKIDNCDISLGHEGSGIVVEAGRNVKHLKEGDPVSIEPGIPCSFCKYCKMGRYNICPNMNFSGLLSTYCAHPAHFCYKIPESMKLEDAALAHPLSLGLHACHRGKVSVGSKVLVLGACPLGISTVISARAMGADKVAIIDTLEKNLKVAHDLCADKTILANNSMSSCELAELILSEMKCRPNVVIDCCGCTKTVNMSILAVEQGGLFVLAGCQSECANIPILEALAKEICLHTSFRSSNMFPKAIGLISSGRADVRKMITHRHEFCDSQKAFDSAVNEVETGAIKVVVNWPNKEVDSKNKKPKT